MPNEIRHKTSTAAGAVPTAAQLTAGELAVNAADGKVYTRKADGTVVELTDVQIMDGGEQFTPLVFSNLAVWLDASDANTLYTTSVGPVTALNAPTDISGCAMWLDGADASTLFTDTARTTPVTTNGDAIAAWADKSGTGAHATNSTLSQRPTYNVAAINTRSAPLFDGINDRLVVSAANRPAAANHTLLCVYRVTSTPILGATPISVKDTASFRSSSSTTGEINWYATTADLTASVGASFGTNTGVIGYTNNNSSVILYKDGNAVSSAISANTAVSTVAGLHIGSREASLEPFPGHICEVVYYTRVLTTAERAQLEAYLAAKWGVANVHTRAVTSGSPVGYWANKGLGGGAFTQPSASRRPLATANYQNGRVAVVSDNTDDWLNTSASAIGINNTVTAATGFFVARFISGNTGAWDFGTLDASGQQTVGNIGIFDDFFSGNRTQGSFSGRSISVTTISAPGTGQSRAWRINGTPMPRATDLAGFTVPTTAYINGNPSANGTFQSFGGGVCEALIYTRVLSTAEVQRVEQYLATKWGVPLYPQVSNLDAQDWIQRVYTAGGTVSLSTATAVNNFCNAIDNAGLRSRFYRLNLFCGDSLTTCLVPLYRGQSLTGTQFGNVTDTNNNFVAADYVETGTAGGLKGNGSNKYINTGFPGNTLAAGNRHLSAYETIQNRDTRDYRSLIGTQDNGGGAYYFTLTNASPGTSLFAAFCANVPTPATHTLGGHWVATDPSTSSIFVYKNGAVVSSSASAACSVTTSNAIFVFATNALSTPATTPDGWTSSRFISYSIGLGLNTTQASTYYNILRAFQAELSRNV